MNIDKHHNNNSNGNNSQHSKQSNERSGWPIDILRRPFAIFSLRDSRHFVCNILTV
jgi:hypothetical protein